jgi:hypothetical protein
VANSFLNLINAVFFPEVGGSTLDSHHGFVVEYGRDRDVDLGRCFNDAFLLTLTLLQMHIVTSFYCLK